MSKIVKQEDPKNNGSKPPSKKGKTASPPAKKEKTPPPTTASPPAKKEKTPPPPAKKEKTPPPPIKKEKTPPPPIPVETAVEEEVVEESAGGEEVEENEDEYEYYEIDENGNEIIVDKNGNPIVGVSEKPAPEEDPANFSETPTISKEPGVLQGLACSMYEGLRNVAESMGIILYDETIEHLVWNISKMPSLEGFCLLLQTGIQLFSTFECNVQAGNAFRDRFYEVLKLFGHPRYGIVEYCIINGLTIENELIYHLESIISSSLRYLSRFARPDHLIYTLVSEKPKAVLLHLNYEVDKITNDIIVALNYKGPLSLSPMKSYNVACDIKSLVEKEKEDPEGFYLYLRNEKALPDAVAREYQQELGEVSQCINKLIIEANILTSDWIGASIGTGLRQRAFQRLWLDPETNQLNPTLEKTVTDLCSIINRSISTESGTLNNEMKALLKRLVNVFTTIPKDDNGNISSMDLIRTLRCIPHQEEDLISVLETFSIFGLQKKRSIMPPPIHDIFWEPGQEEEWTKVITATRSWVSITGPSLSGKSHRLISLCHSLKERDILWVDFYKTSSLKEAISRVNSQLCLKGCIDLAGTSSELFELFTIVRKGSVVVFDNVDPESSYVDPFFSEIMKHHKEFSSKLCFVVTSISTCSFIEKVMNPVHITIDKLSDEDAISMASEMKPDVNQSTLLPVDPIALQKAGENLPGKIITLAKMCPLNVVRDLAKSLPDADDLSFPDALSAAEEAASIAVHNELSEDEKLCAKYILPESAPFFEPLCWAFAKSVFEDDIARWNIAWKALVEIGWLKLNGDLGYSLSYLAAKCPKSTVYETDDIDTFELDLWNTYSNHYALSFLNMCSLMKSNPLSKEQYHFHFRGFRDVLSLFGPAHETAVSELSNKKRSVIAVFERVSTALAFFDEHIPTMPSLGEDKAKDVSANLVGNITSFYQIIPNNHRVQLSRAIYYSLTIDDGLSHFKARLDYARQLKNLGQKENIIDAVDVLTLPNDFNLACGSEDYITFAGFYSTLAICHLIQGKKALVEKDVAMAMSYWNNIEESVKKDDPVFIEFYTAFPGKFDPPAPKKSLLSFLAKKEAPAEKNVDSPPVEKKRFFMFGKSSAPEPTTEPPVEEPPKVEEEVPTEAKAPVEEEAPKPKKKVVKKKVIKKKKVVKDEAPPESES